MKSIKTGIPVVAALALIVACAFIAKSGVLRPASGANDKKEKGVPVKVSVASRQAIPVDLTAIGTVQAFNTVSVRARIDGQIERIRFREGDTVKKGDVLVELDKRPFEVQLHAAIAQKAKDKAQLDNIARDLKRYEVLVAQDSIAVQTLDTTRANFEQMKATVDADQAQIESAQLQLNYATIRSPIDGRLGAKLADEGNIVHASDANGLVVVNQIHPVLVNFSLPQSILAVLRDQQAHSPLKAQAVAADGASSLEEGGLTLIDNQIDVATGTIHCKASFQNAGEAMWPGAFVMIKIKLKTLPDAVAIPLAAVQAGAEHPFVYVVKPNNIVELREVVTGPATGSTAAILTGLSAGEKVVVEGQFQLENGKHVEIQPNQAATRH
jgi:multidrug efflux system membrane fusion protein